MNPKSIDFEGILNSISEGVFTVDTEMNITTFNRAAEKITGYLGDEAIGKKCYQLLKGSHCCGENCLMRNVVRDGEKGYSTDVMIINRDGFPIPVEISVMPLLNKDGHIIGGFEILSDQREIASARQRAYKRDVFQNIVGKDHKMQEIYELIEAVAPHHSSVLIMGESGTGKELVAQAIHYLSNRRDKPFVKVNTATLSSTLVESELFGHERGAFTGASTTHQGRFELADKGTIFLDEIGEISLEVQSKLLRVLQEGEFERVGGKKTNKVDTRVIAATNRNLVEDIKNGRFRSDLFYRLNVFPIKLPPLRERQNDIPLLIDHFIHRFNAYFQTPKKGMARDALDFLMQYNYPGNIRELENAIEYAFIRGRGDYVLLRDLPPDMFEQSKIITELSYLKDWEKHHIEVILEQCGGNKQKAAKLLGIARKTLYNKIREYKI
ncbi:RNA polymerase sigma factor 54 interaction domain protein [Acididesulfobacillus acetoxydans]|uniref:RNA polymerase sigma factor 54 interaction domain protein n=1 Tax=Acididesulfobacillus acetoxydans TaxID=1561005 RepID=A0A8S0Y0M9_9FIRM|nr:sigma 54-interacting transcriptional regulator [Acididesulfobacillus acetoxydans]CAA7603307.1 RNA polymerase sigma factor 54 interaction domain protein [Acididesulfobacillus acetoxydans]